MNTDPPTALDTATVPHRVGAVLAAARTAAGLELADVARETRVPLRHLRAIENDSHDQLPALPYAIGFVKSFARAVGKDAEAMATQFRAETTKTAHAPMLSSLEPLDERRLPPRGLMLLSILAVLIVIAAVVAYSAGMFGAPTPQLAAPVVALPPAVTPATLPGTIAPDTMAPGAAVVGAAAPGVAASALPTSGQVTITASEEVWIKIYDRVTKQVVKIGILAPGERYDVPADQPNLALWTGKAGVLKVTVGGRALPPLGGPVETVRDVNLTPAGLAARAAAAPAATAAVG